MSEVALRNSRISFPRPDARSGSFAKENQRNIGGAAGKLTKTGYMVDVGAQIHQRLGCTIENIMGIPSTGFGWVTNSGPFLGLSLAT
jgi:hypothetical protein